MEEESDDDSNCYDSEHMLESEESDIFDEEEMANHAW
jgi:hypothetical protein